MSENFRRLRMSGCLEGLLGRKNRQDHITGIQRILPASNRLCKLFR
jgi:hypothetical protein